MHKPLAIFNWSGGKDSALALHYVLQADDLEIRYLLTTVNDGFNRVAMHGVREALLLAQVDSLCQRHPFGKIPLIQVRLPEMPDMEVYERELNNQLVILKKEGIDHSVFGDIFLEDLRTYREKQLSKIGMTGVFPLWKRDSMELVKEFIALGYKTIVVCAQASLQDFCGRVIDQAFLDDLPEGIDPAGENGEFHTFVFDGPIFSNPISFSLGEKVYKTFPSPNKDGKQSGYWYIDLLPL